jgi:hypothetical protein
MRNAVFLELFIKKIYPTRNSSTLDTVHCFMISIPCSKAQQECHRLEWKDESTPILTPCGHSAQRNGGRVASNAAALATQLSTDTTMASFRSRLAAFCLGATVTGGLGFLRLHYDILKANALVRETFSGMEEEIHNVDQRALRVETELERLRAQLEQVKSQTSSSRADAKV